MKNKERKQEILQTDKKALKDYGNKRYELLKNPDQIKRGYTDGEGVVHLIPTIDDFDLNDLDYECLEQMRKAKNVQRKRIVDRMKWWERKEYTIVFNTFTFNEATMKLSPRIRRRLIAETLKQCEDIIPDYIGNIDYGDNTEREHYHHALAIKNKEDIKKLDGHNTQVDIPKLRKLWKPYGTIYLKKEYEKGGLAGYISKLVSHSIKVHQSKLMTPKGTEYQIYQAFQRADKKKERAIHNFAQGNIITANVVKSAENTFDNEVLDDLGISY